LSVRGGRAIGRFSAELCRGVETVFWAFLHT
jgi:hypothetical protein